MRLRFTITQDFEPVRAPVIPGIDSYRIFTSAFTIQYAIELFLEERNKIEAVAFSAPKITVDIEDMDPELTPEKIEFLSHILFGNPGKIIKKGDS